MEWRPATADDSFTKGEAVIVTADNVRGVVLEDAPAGSDSVQVELEKEEGVEHESGYAQLGNVSEVAARDLSVLRED